MSSVRSRALLVTTAGAVALSLLVLAAPQRAQQTQGESGEGSGPTAPGPQQAQLTGGAAVYAKYCAQCHGANGNGRGIASPLLMPAPRDFTSGKYQIRSTATGNLPTPDDIKNVILRGIPGTGMPGFQEVTDVVDDLDSLVAHLQSFSPKFQNAKPPEMIPIPKDPGYNADQVDAARKVYTSIGCAGCHGDEGRGDGPTAPTLKDDWGQQIRPADLSRPWTFNGGGRREDIFRSISTGLNGTPMAGFASALSEEQRWQLVDFITDLAGGKTEEAPYASLVVAKKVEGKLDVAQGAKLFEGAEPALFPLLGQIIQPGRAFQPATIAVETRAVYNADEVALLVTWHDIRADEQGNNGPDFELPEQEDHPGLAPAVSGSGQAPTPTDPFAEEEQGSATSAPSADPFADEEVSPASTPATPNEGQPSADPFAEEEAGTAGGAEGAAAAAESAGAGQFSDAVAVQFPRQLTDGVRRPYFIFGDPQNPVELWFVDLANPGKAELWEGKGSADLQPGEGETPEVHASFSKGEWSVILKRSRNAGRGIAFPDDTFVPVAFSVWDGFHGERGNKRALSAWYNLYLPPAETPSPWVAMAKAAGVVLVVELLVIFLVRRRARRRAAMPAPSAATARVA
jgi:mono/diheme cytochrome c family protein